MSSLALDRRAALLLAVLGLWSRAFADGTDDASSAQHFRNLESECGKVVRGLLDAGRVKLDFEDWLRLQRDREDVLGDFARTDGVSMARFPELAKLIVANFPGDQS